MFDSVDALIAEYTELQGKLSDPAVHADAGLSKKLNRRFAELSKIVSANEKLKNLMDDLAAAKEFASDDEALAAEVPGLETAVQEATETLRSLLIPRDPDDGRDVIMEIKGGEGGEESALFAADLLRMYLHYAESRGWKSEVLDKTESDMGVIRTSRSRLSPLPPTPQRVCGRASNMKVAFIASSACPSRNLRAVSTPPPRVS